jgi:hypothetical protein
MDEILSFTKPEVQKLEIVRGEKTRILEATITVKDHDKLYIVKLVGPNDIDVLTELFEARSIWATKTTDAQKEYGIYDFFIMSDGTFDCSVDLIEVVIKS